jgi:hypothetical protein
MLLPRVVGVSAGVGLSGIGFSVGRVVGRGVLVIPSPRL